ncbi:hypothetical protein [Spirosoma jeollabukense]
MNPNKRGEPGDVHLLGLSTAYFLKVIDEIHSRPTKSALATYPPNGKLRVGHRFNPSLISGSLRNDPDGDPWLIYRCLYPKNATNRFRWLTQSTNSYVFSSTFGSYFLTPVACPAMAP